MTLPQRARALFQDDTLPAGFEWVDWLTARHMRLFAVELNAALANPNSENVQELLDAWAATAELDHAPDVQEAIARNRQGPFKPIGQPWANQQSTR